MVPRFKRAATYLMLQLTDDVSTSTLFKIAQLVKVNYQIFFEKPQFWQTWRRNLQYALFFIMKLNRHLHPITFNILGAGEPQYLVDFRGGRL